MVRNVGKGSGNWPALTVDAPITPAPPFPKKGFATEAVETVGSSDGFSALMLMFAVACVRWEECDPTKPASMATPNGSCRWTSNEYWCTRGDLEAGSRIESVWPMPVRSPRLFPVGLATPVGNGFVRLFAGVELPSLLAT